MDKKISNEFNKKYIEKYYIFKDPKSGLWTLTIALVNGNTRVLNMREKDMLTVADFSILMFLLPFYARWFPLIRRDYDD